ncbi:dynein regulatory complex protein 10 [Anolis carolinensis]|uniref:Dynein regulatory complex protein 10 n=1 Tax=Anolis carolinensis TaxID=28377 RepID=H9G977_ANOCA|nr:PREDICTED: IQ domain-containing protein D [Anolis carolinensis]XP_016852090.1 PREDICTED: IQ domain-containing protein D [Anolis carolinensis]|eukprot:XP_016852089.1 PREDICTED: IQ domain-containing protein D [Anolis carolinensis]
MEKGTSCGTSECVQGPPSSLTREVKKTRFPEHIYRPKSSPSKSETSSPVEVTGPEPTSHLPYVPVISYRAKRLNQRLPMKAQGPGRTRLVTVETKKIMSVLDEAILRAELVTTFPYLMQHLEAASMVLGPELTGALKEHLRLSNILTATRSRLDGTGPLHKDTHKRKTGAAKDPTGHLPLVTYGLQGSVRNILRLFDTNSETGQIIRSFARRKRLSANLFLKSLVEFRMFFLERLLTTPLEDKEWKELKEELSEQDKKNKELIAWLEEEVTAAVLDRDEELSRKDVIIKELKSQLHNLANCADSQIQRTRAEAEEQQKEAQQGAHAKCLKLQQELNQLRAQFNALIAENQDAEKAIRKKKFKVEMEIENWVQKYDVEMVEKQKEIEEIDVVYSVVKEHLADLREKLRLLDQEHAQIKEERKMKLEQKEKSDQEMAVLVRAATIIQAFWKGYQVRSILRTRRKKKKGKGKKPTKK